jgi:CheY-like chemotaxis protein
MRRIHSASAIPRHDLFVLADGTFVVQWDDTRVQDLLTGRFRDYYDEDFGHAITDGELNQLKSAGRVEHFNRVYVWLFSLPEPGRYASPMRTQEQPRSRRVRSYYLNTTLPESRLDEIKALLSSTGLASDFTVTIESQLIAIVGKNGAFFLQLEDAENAQKHIINTSPDTFKDVAIAFIEASHDLMAAKDEIEHIPGLFDLDTIIASQSDTSVTEGKQVVLACNHEIDSVAIQNILSKMKLEVRHATTAWNALQLLEMDDCPTDLLIMDLQLPDMHGWQLLNKIREISSLRDLPIVVIADSASANDQAFALTVAKVEVYLVRPVSMLRLRQAVWLTFKSHILSP